MISSMRYLRFRFAGVLVAVVMMMALSGGGCSKSKNTGSQQPAQDWVQEIRDRINDTVTDPDRATQMLLLVNDVEKMMFDFNSDVEIFYKDLIAVNADYDATREDLEKVIADFDAKRLATRKKVTAIRFEISNLATDEEWEELSDRKHTLLEDWQKGTYEQSE